jgi:hypothetical protein
MSIVLLILSALALFGSVAFMVYKRHKKPKRIMREGKLLKSEMVSINGEQLYVEKVRFKDWHVSIHSLYVISDELAEGHTVVEQR